MPSTAQKRRLTAAERAAYAATDARMPPPEMGAGKLSNIRLRWAGGTHRFSLLGYTRPTALPRMDQWDLDVRAGARRAFTLPVHELHDREHAILQRLISGGWGRTDVERPITVALRNGGDFAEAPRGDDLWPEITALVAEHVLNRPLAFNVPLAQAIVMVALYGVPPAISDAGWTPDQFVSAVAGQVEAT